MRIVIAAAGLFLASVAPAAAAGTPDQSKPADPLDKVVCKSDTFVGSKIPKRICLTRRQWDQGTQDGKDAMETQRSRRWDMQPPKSGPN